jgi:hypothetical protein
MKFKAKSTLRLRCTIMYIEKGADDFNAEIRQVREP